jgi:hypothetical protein
MLKVQVQSARWRRLEGGCLTPEMLKDQARSARGRRPFGLAPLPSIAHCGAAQRQGRCRDCPALGRAATQTISQMDIRLPLCILRITQADRFYADLDQVGSVSLLNI